MNDNRTALAAALAGGYLLGRTKKAKLAIAVGSYMAGKKLGMSPGQLLTEGLGRLPQTPQLQQLTDQLRDELLTAGKAAVSAAANRRLTGLADTLRERTETLTGAAAGGKAPSAGYQDRDEDDYEDDSGGYEDADLDEDEEEEPDEEPEPAPPRKRAKKAPAKKTPAKKTAAKKTAAKKAPAKKTAQARRDGRQGGGRR
ncbi:hypothetical protein ACGFZL_16455 [Streptomyces sp. NPDC048182]|uniref:hypothetical protein n=1 Tax=Streptomyces sp. NPDC048182 TaxID=3365507 RepID=UPI003717F176